MLKSKFLISFFIASLVVSYVKYSNNAEFEIAEVLGSAIGIMIFPMILTYLIKGINLLFRRKFSEEAFLSTFSICWIFIALSSIISVYAQTLETNNSGFTYSPLESEYSIMFSKKPIITTSAVLHKEQFLKGELVELGLPDGSVQKVEYYQLNKTVLDLIDEEYALNFLNEYSRVNGFSYPSFQYKETKDEKLAELRGYKDIKDKSGNTVPITYHVKVYIKGTSFFVTYVGAPSKVFPTNEIIRFWKSMKSKEGIPINLQISNTETNNGWSEENLATLRTLYVGALSEGIVPGKIEDKQAFCDCAIEKTKNSISYIDFIADKEKTTQIILNIWKKCEKELAKK